MPIIIKIILIKLNNFLIIKYTSANTFPYYQYGENPDNKSGVTTIFIRGQNPQEEE
jgi:hypothetical protein